MVDASEKLALTEVQARLNERFPHLSDEVVEAAVRVAYSELTGPIREFVPVLVEHMARERLASLAADERDLDTSRLPVLTSSGLP
jgi:hypothetical protein